MLDKKMAKALNDHINAEFFSAYLYLDFSNYFAQKGLDGYANWYMVQAQEERDHAMLFIKYLQDNGEAVILQGIGQPDVNVSEDLDALQGAADHEAFITGLIHKLYAMANETHDFRTMQFLGWFIKEQGEEETSAEKIVEQYKLFGTDAKGLYALDREMAGRTYAPPSMVMD